MKLNKKKRIEFSGHAIKRFIGRLRCPAPRHPLKLMKKILHQSQYAGRVKDTKSGEEGESFEHEGWKFILNLDLNKVITCERIKGNGASRNKPRYRHKRAREEQNWKKEKWA